MPTIDQLETMLATDPDDVFVNYGLAIELANAGRTNEAGARFDRVIELDPDYHAAFYHKGNMLIGMGRTAEARQVLAAGVGVTVRVGDDHAEREMRELLESIEVR